MSSEQKEDEEIQLQIIDQTKKKIVDIFGRGLLIFYTILGIAILTFMIFALYKNTGNIYTLMFILILICTLLTTIISTYSLIKYGRLMDQINRLKNENRKYDLEIEELIITKSKLKQDIDDLDKEVIDLNNHSQDLNEQSNEFNDLLIELKEIFGSNEDGDDILNYVDQLNNTFNKMNQLIYENEKTYLLSIYYETAFRDDDNDMNQSEYKRFLQRIDQKFRNKFERLGPFENLCNNDKNTINLEIFLKIIDNVLKESSDVLGQEFMRQYSHQKTLSLSIIDQTKYRL